MSLRIPAIASVTLPCALALVYWWYSCKRERVSGLEEGEAAGLSSEICTISEGRDSMVEGGLPPLHGVNSMDLGDSGCCLEAGEDQCSDGQTTTHLQNTQHPWEMDFDDEFLLPPGQLWSEIVGEMESLDYTLVKPGFGTWVDNF